MSMMLNTCVLSLWTTLLVGLHRLAPRLRNRKALLFVDNNRIRDGVIKGSSKVDDLFAMLSSMSMMLNTCVLSLWTTLLVGFHRLAPRLRNRKALLFVDNNRIRDAVIKGSSKVDDLFAMLSSMSMMLNTCVLSLWTTLLVGFHRLAPRLRNRKALLFVDNNRIRDAVIKGFSKVDDLFAMLSSISLMLNTCVLSLWTTRITSKSNPADWPSRGQAEEAACALGFALEKPWEAPGSPLEGTRSFFDFMCSFGKKGVVNGP